MLSRSGWRGHKCDGDFLINLLINRFKEIMTGSESLFSNGKLVVHYNADI